MMSSDLKTVESAAIKLLTRAIEDETNGKFQSSLVCYQEAIELFMTVFKGCTEANKKNHYQKKISEYMDRAEQVKATVVKLTSAGNFNEEIRIDEGSIHNSYLSIFKAYLDDTLTHVEVDDAYIRSFHQVCNFLRFCEMLVLKCPRFKYIQLTTTSSPERNHEQKSNLELIASNLLKRGINLTVKYAEHLHDREIRFNTGWIIKVGRGLDYFKRVEKLDIGYFNMELRPCHATTVNVFHKTHTKQN